MEYRDLTDELSWHRFACAVVREYVDASQQHGEHFASVHEAYAVILEELDEFWEHVRQPTGTRDAGAMISELVQIAAMACKAAVTIEMRAGIVNR